MEITKDSWTESLRWTDLVSIGRVAKAQGRFGEVVVQPFTDAPERFETLERVFLEAESGEPVPRAVESMRLHKGRPVLKLEGVSDIGGAETLAGREIRVPASELEPLEDGSFYHYELLGLEVFDRVRGLVGVVEEVLTTGGTDVLVVRGGGGDEALVPLCQEICRTIDLRAGRIELEAPEGLLSLNEAAEVREGS